MNSGEGLRFAAKSKSGQLGNLLFKDTKPNKNKKFGYKKKGQSFPIRKVGAAQDSEAENKPATQKKFVPDRSGSQKSRSSNPPDAEPKPGRKTNNPGTEQEARKQGKDFVRKNAQRVSGKSKDEGAIDRNTVTLTQDQLNAILKSIGQVSGSDNVASIAIENGDIKVNTAEKDTPPEKGDDTKKKEEDEEKEEDSTTTNKNRVTSAAESENILSLLAKANKKNEKFPGSAPSSKPPTPSKTPASNTNTTRATSSKDDAKEKTRKEEATRGENKRDGHQTDLKELEFANLSLAERKRRKWKQELDEQVALKRQQVEQEKYVRDVASRMGGGPQYGSATRSQYEGTVAPSRQAVQLDELRKSTENFSPDTSPRGVAPSSLGAIATQRAVPAAMRASFLIGGQGSAGSRVSDYNAQVKKRQQQEWLQELEQQRIEAEQRKRKDKQHQRELDSDLSQQWAEPVNPPKTQKPTQGHQGRVRDDTALMARGSEPEAVSQKEEVVEQPRSAPPQGGDALGESGSLTNRSEERSHIRANNMLVDPAELERREIKKQKHMEHMLAVKAQVEEKQRLKREAEESRRREEAEQEMRLAQQRENLKHQFDFEKNKKRKKEEEEAARQKALADSMQTAYQEAQQEKHQKRLNKLGMMGHDTSNLRRSWDNQNDSPEGHPQQHIPQAAYQTAYQTTPRMQQSTEPHTVRHSPPAPVAHHVNDQVTHQVTHQVPHQVQHHVTEPPVMKDAFTSPVYDQAVQTEYHFPPSGDFSLQTIQIGREKSAGVEYKPGRQPAKGEPGKSKKSDRSQTEKTKERETRTVREEPQQVKNKRLSQRTSRASSPGSEQDYTRNKPVAVVDRPVWGASSKNKKLQRNSDKDLTVSKKKRDERRKQRAADLLAEQERNAPVRLTRTKRPKSPVEDTKRRDPIRGTKPSRSRAVSSANQHTTHEGRTDSESVRDRADSQPWTDRRSYLPDTPPLKNGDFVPFMRTDEPVMSEDSVPVTPESRQMQRQRKIVKTIVADDSPRQGKEEIRKLPVQKEKDPLLNPDRLKDSEQRQERILQQLSHLRQGLMMKQREMELGLGSPVTM